MEAQRSLLTLRMWLVKPVEINLVTLNECYLELRRISSHRGPGSIGSPRMKLIKLLTQIGSVILREGVAIDTCNHTLIEYQPYRNSVFTVARRNDRDQYCASS